jgi:hypothetical protein
MCILRRRTLLHKEMLPLAISGSLAQQVDLAPIMGVLRAESEPATSREVMSLCQKIVRHRLDLSLIGPVTYGARFVAARRH